MSDKTVRSHIVPKMHLRNWGDEGGGFHAYEITEDKFFPATPNGVCVNKNYYDIDQNVDLPYPIEDVLSQEVEGPAAKALRKLACKNTQHLTLGEFEDLCYYFGFLVARTPFAHKMMDQIAIKTRKELLLKKLKEDNREIAKKTRQALEDGDIELKIRGNDHNILAMFIFGTVMPESYKQQKWTLLIAGKNREFIMNDHPVITITLLSKYQQMTQTETVIPISKDVCLLLEKKQPGPKRVGATKVGASIVREINKRITLHSNRLILATNKPLLNKMKKVRDKNKHIVDHIKTQAPSGSAAIGAPFQRIGNRILN